MSDISIKKYGPEHKEDLVNFLGKGLKWSKLDKNERKTLFEWKYEKNPYLKEPLNFVAMEGEKLIGHIGFVVQRFILGERSHLFATPCDSMVHPDHRNKGVFSYLVEVSNLSIIEDIELELFLSLSPTETTAKVTKRSGYVPVGEREKLYNLSIFSIAAKSKKDVIVDKNISLEKNSSAQITRDIKVDEIVTLMEDSRDTDKITNQRDIDFYRWRFLDCPKDHIFIYLWKDHELKGYISLEMDPIFIGNKKVDYYSILEYGYIDTSTFDHLIKIMTDNMKDVPMMFYAFTKNKEEISIMKRYGFQGTESMKIRILQKKSVLDRRGLPGILIKPAVKEVKDDDYSIDHKDIRSQDNWSLFWSDVQ